MRSSVLLLIVLASLAAGCAKAQARGAPEGPPLQVPQPPPRVIAALEEPPAQEEAAPPPAPVPPPVKPAPAARVARPDPKPEATVEPPPPPVAEAKPEPRTLRAPGDAARERAIRDRLTIASRDLTRVDYSRLSAGRRSQYDQSKRFIQQAEQAIKEQNLVFAATLADKAATLAADLLGR